MKLRITIVLGLTILLTLVLVSATLADGPLITPTTGQPGAPTVTCGSPGATMTPGGSATATGSAFNPNGTAGGVYAGNPGTASLTNSNSTASVSQYDVACLQVTTH